MASDPDQQALLALLAAELELARDQIEALGSTLCADLDLMARHIDGLQSLDHAGQRCATIAAILRSDDLAGAIRQAPLESIASRLATRTA